MDVRCIEILPDKAKEADELFDDNRIDILVNSAGVVTKYDLWNTDEEEHDAIMVINAKGTFFISQATN